MFIPASSYSWARRTFDRQRQALLSTRAGEYVNIRRGTIVSFHQSLEEAHAVRGSFSRVWTFLVESEADEIRRLAADPRDTWTLIGEQFLETNMPQDVDVARRVLRARGFSRSRIMWLRVVAATGLWWNIAWWEWTHLDYADVLQGWKLNATLVVALVALMAMLQGWYLVTALLLVALVLIRRELSRRQALYIAMRQQPAGDGRLGG